MALIILHNGKCLTLPADKALEMFRVWNGEIKGTDKQVQFTNTVARIYLSKLNAPESYTRKYAPKSEASKEYWFRQRGMA